MSPQSCARGRPRASRAGADPLESRDLQGTARTKPKPDLMQPTPGSGRAYTAIDLQKAQTSTRDRERRGCAQSRQRAAFAGQGRSPKTAAHTSALGGCRGAGPVSKMRRWELNRYKRLFEQDVVPKQRLDSVQTAYDVAKAQWIPRRSRPASRKRVLGPRKYRRLSNRSGRQRKLSGWPRLRRFRTR